jgi:Transposase DDE domain group 1
LQVHRSRSVRRAKVMPNGQNLVSHAGTALLAELADRSGLTMAMSVAMADCGISWHTHDPGVVLTHLAVAIADGADCLADLSALREQDELFGPVASVPTAWRAVHAATAVELREIPKAVAAARERAWAAAPPGDSLILDFDATLVTAHSDKQDAAPTYKGGYGFHPLGVWCDTTNEPLAALLRPGNAGSNDASDHLELLDRAFSALPAEYQVGHDVGDTPDMAVHRVLVRADSAGATHDFVRGLVEANCEYSVGFPIDGRVREALMLVQEEDWRPAVELDGGIRQGAWVSELTDLVDLSGWAGNPRLIVRRERPHPGAQLTLFDTAEGFRHTCFLTRTQGGDIAGLELRHRGHARVEDRVRSWKDCGLANLPFDSVVMNETWVAVSLVAGALLAWSQMVCFDGHLAKAEPKTMRYRVLHVAALLVHRGRGLVLRLDETWSWAKDLARAFTRLRAAIP